MPKSDDQDPGGAPTRQRLIEATLLEIVDRGWGGVRTRGVAARAGVNNALVHYHFGSIDALRLEAAAAAFDRVKRQFGGEAIASPGTVADMVTDLAEVIAHTRMDDPIWNALLEVLVQVPREPALAAMTKDLLDGFRAAITHRLEAAVAAGELPGDLDAAGTAIALTAMLDGLALHAYVDDGLDVRRAGRAAASLVRVLMDERREET